MSGKVTIWVLVLGFLGGSCATEKPVDRSWGMTLKEVEQLRGREFKRLKRHKGEVPGAFKFYIESHGPYKQQRKKDYLLISAKINDYETIDCFIFDDRRLVANHVKELTEELSKSATRVEYLKSRSGLFDGDPYLSLQTQLLAPAGEIKLIKVISTRYKRRQITCVNQDMGYVKSFRRVVGDFMASIDDGQKGENRFEQVSFISKGKNRFGYQQDTLTSQKGGGDLLRNELHSLEIESPGEVVAYDQVMLQAVDKEFKLKELFLERYTNGYKKKQVTVRPEGQGTYNIDYKLEDKGVQASYPLSNMTSSLRFEKLIYKKVSEFKKFKEMTFWPTHPYRKPQETQFSFQKWVKGSKYIKVKFGKSTEIWRFNKDSQVDLKIIKQAGGQLIHKRAYLHGSY